MKLLIIFGAVLAVSLATDLEKKEEYEENEQLELLAQESNIELLRTARNDESLKSAATSYNSNYIPPSQRPPKPWNPPTNTVPQNPSYIPNNPSQNVWNNQVNVPQGGNYNPAPIPPPQNSYQPSQTQNYVPSAPVQNDFQPNVPAPPQNYFPQNNVPQNTFTQTNVPQTSYPQNYVPQTTYPQNNVPQATYPQNTVPQATYPQNTAPQNDATYNPQAPQNDWYYPAVIKNDQYFGENGNYNYEYQIADGTHVGEQGWLNNPNTDNEVVVKKGWYSYTGADGRVYTVTWWADDSGYHAFGDHLPTPPPVPAAIQAALDQAAKDEAEKNKYPTQTPGYYPTTQPPVYYPPVTQQPTYYPQQPSYYPQQTYPQQQNNPGHYGK